MSIFPWALGGVQSDAANNRSDYCSTEPTPVQLQFDIHPPMHARAQHRHHVPPPTHSVTHPYYLCSFPLRAVVFGSVEIDLKLILDCGCSANSVSLYHPYCTSYSIRPLQIFPPLHIPSSICPNLSVRSTYPRACIYCAVGVRIGIMEAIQSVDEIGPF